VGGEGDEKREGGDAEGEVGGDEREDREGDEERLEYREDGEGGGEEGGELLEEPVEDEEGTIDLRRKLERLALDYGKGEIDGSKKDRESK
jgi:hypothetical protein